MTKTDQIRKLLAKGWPTGRITAHLGLSDKNRVCRVCRVRWCDARPGYNAKKMRGYRSDPAYVEREYDRQAIYRRNKRRSVAA